MKKQVQIGEVVTGDFQENTLTIEIEGQMILQAGKCAVVPIELYDTSETILKQRDELFDLVKSMRILSKSWLKYNKESLGYKAAIRIENAIKNQ